MEKPIIGMISPRAIKEDSPFDNYTKFINTYPKRIIEAGGIPIGLVFPDGKFEIEEAELCDGFVLQGGPILESCQINIVKYAIDKKKPILGICLGMQTMAGYNWVYNELGNTTYNEIDNFFKPEYEEFFLEKREGHNNLDPFYISQIEKSKHNIILDEDSRLYEIYKTNIISEPSLHGFVLKDNTLGDSKIFKVTGKSKDGTIEAIEGLDTNHFIVGVQFHPELEKQNNILFKRLVKEARKK
ncbi:MAG: gamma-glutamyl-gamma-aminobutyrate hydrolase family protein [Bacilli bacterium]|nr:gamma-glutamyl-gamma-aminobutyrate hydrolase family protein [Bacilli bacterium]